jgi:RNA polymerase-binding transcription factor DksA
MAASMGKQPARVIDPSEWRDRAMDERRIRASLEDERTRLHSLREGLSEAAQPVEPEIADPAAGGHLADAGSEMFERSRDLSIVEDLEAQLVEVDHAVSRIEHGTYGRCEACGREIDAERLQARPAARFCLEDQREAEREAHLRSTA